MSEDFSLPVYTALPELKVALSSAGCAVLHAPPGSGKSTIVPLELLNEPWLSGRKIIVLQPRRLAAKSVAFRLAENSHTEPGDLVGYRVRFEQLVSNSTRIEVITEGILIRMIQNDNFLEEYGLIIFDEFHERTLNTDLCFVFCKEIRDSVRPDLRLLFMSATLKTEGLQKVFGTLPVIQTEGRQYPVEIFYETAGKHELSAGAIASKIISILPNSTGHILVFLPGYSDLIKVQTILCSKLDSNSIFLLYGDLPLSQQHEVIKPSSDGIKKIILSTDIAETSLTIDGIGVVIDSGFCKAPAYEPGTGMTRLRMESISKDSSIQRAGRAGRTGPGTCYKMYSEATWYKFKSSAEPEILRADLSGLMLELGLWGNISPKQYSWIDTPPKGAAESAQELLENLSAFSEGKITEKGKSMARFPAHPRISHMIDEGIRLNLPGLAADLAAFLQEKDPLPEIKTVNIEVKIEALHGFRNKTISRDSTGNLPFFNKICQEWHKLLNNKSQLYSFTSENTGLLLATAYPDRIAKKQNKTGPTYKMVSGRVATLPDGDEMIVHDWIAIGHLSSGIHENIIRIAAPLNPYDLANNFGSRERYFWDENKTIIQGQKEIHLGGLIVEKKQISEIPDHERFRLLLDLIHEKGLEHFCTDSFLEWKKRVASFKIWNDQEDTIRSDWDFFLTQIEENPMAVFNKIKSYDGLKKVDIGQFLMNQFDWSIRQQIDEQLPTTLEVPTGSKIKLEYFEDGRPPVLAVRLQEIFGWKETPKIYSGRIPVILHLLSPAYRPVQITQDLNNFWKNTYTEVRKDLRGRYPKHFWPEDPFTAEAIRGVKKKV